MTFADFDALPCGEDADELLEQVADGRSDQRSEHQVGCVHCQAGLGGVRQRVGPPDRQRSRAIYPFRTGSSSPSWIGSDVWRRTPGTPWN